MPGRLRGVWAKLAGVIGGLAFLEVGARIGIPGVTGRAVTDYLHGGGGTGLLTLYERLGGGGLSRGGVLAIGVVPYLSAKIMIGLAYRCIPRLRARTDDPREHRRLATWTRLLTVGLSVIQSYGFARFVESIPGAVAHPGAAFIARTVSLLTAGSIAAMIIVDQIARTSDDEEEIELGDAASLLGDAVVVPSAAIAGSSSPLGAQAIRPADRIER
jgi:preprotein translocase subunit SecY